MGIAGQKSSHEKWKTAVQGTKQNVHENASLGLMSERKVKARGNQPAPQEKVIICF